MLDRPVSGRNRRIISTISSRPRMRRELSTGRIKLSQFLAQKREQKTNLVAESAPRNQTRSFLLPPVSAAGADRRILRLRPGSVPALRPQHGRGYGSGGRAGTASERVVVAVHHAFHQGDEKQGKGVRGGVAIEFTRHGKQRVMDDRRSLAEGSPAENGRLGPSTSIFFAVCRR